MLGGVDCGMLGGCGMVEEGEVGFDLEVDVLGGGDCEIVVGGRVRDGGRGWA